MIDIIIPAYNAHKTIEETICSIVYQDFSDNVKVYIVDDCSSEGYSEIVDFYSDFIEIHELKLEKNSGPGQARQYGIENSDSEYIIFIDSDDVFSDCYAIKNLYNEIHSKQLDMVISTFIEEVYNGFNIKAREKIWLHGKIYRREFIEKNGIKFPLIRVNEDSAFNESILLTSDKIGYLDCKTYIWRNNRTSITRTDLGSIIVNATIEYAIGIYFALQNGIRLNGNKDKIGRLAFAALVYIYCCYLEHFRNKEEVKSRILFKEAAKIKKLLKDYPIEEQIELDVLHNQLCSYYNRNNRKYFLKNEYSFMEFYNMLEVDEL